MSHLVQPSRLHDGGSAVEEPATWRGFNDGSLTRASYDRQFYRRKREIGVRYRAESVPPMRSNHHGFVDVILGTGQ